MPPRDWRLRFEDILEAIGKIQAYVEGMSYEEFAADTKTLDAVIRNLTIIGEAARNVPYIFYALVCYAGRTFIPISFCVWQKSPDFFLRFLL